LNIITTIKELAVAQNKIVLMTIHQPRTDIMVLLDKVLLLTMGKCVWYGSNKGALDHFATLGYQIPENTNPSDFYLDITTLDQRSDELRAKTKERIDMFTKAYDEKKVVFEYKGADPNHKDEKTQWPSMWIGELSIILGRNWKDTLRDKAVLGATFGQSVFLCV
jgi:ABC-type multidrug transport system ATPase subunit